MSTNTPFRLAMTPSGRLLVRPAPTAAGDVITEKPSPEPQSDLTKKTDAQLARLKWTKELVEAHPEINKKGSDYYLGERRVILEGMDVKPLLTQEYRAVPPSIGYLRWFSLLQKDYVGLRRQDVQNFLANQDLRQKYRGLKKPSASKATVPREPGVRWQCDFAVMGDKWRNEKYPQLMVFVDTYSKYTWAIASREQTAEYQIRGLEAWLKHLKNLGAPKPRFLGTDNGFNSEEFAGALKRHGIKHVAGQAYHPQTQGLVERANRTIKGYLTSYADAHGKLKSWPDYLDQVLAVINTSFHRTLKTGRDPYSVLTGEKEDALSERLKGVAEKRRNYQLYVKGALPEGTAVKLSLRVAGPSDVKDQIKSGIRKGYLPSYTNAVFKVRKHGETSIGWWTKPASLSRVHLTGLIFLPYPATAQPMLGRERRRRKVKRPR
jgi:transposase InsO family protein